MRTRQRERLSQLVYDPLARWVRRGVEVENSSAAVFDHKEAIKHTERQCWNGKEVKSRDDFAMVVEEGRPALGFALIVVTLQSMQISGYGRLRNLESQLEQFPMNASAPQLGLSLFMRRID